MPANCAWSRLAIAAAVSPESLAPSAPTCAGVKASTCVALSPPTAATDSPEMSVPSAINRAAVSAETWAADTLASCGEARAWSCAAVRLFKTTAATAAAGKPEMSMPKACNFAGLNEAAWVAVTADSCAAVSALSWVAVSALRVAPASCAAFRLAMALTLSDATRVPSTATSAAVRPSTCVALSAAMRPVPAPMSAPN